MKVEIDTPVYYINLKDSIDRNKNVQNIMNNLGFTNVSRIEAIDTRTLEKANKYKDIIDPTHFDYLKKDIVAGKRKFFGALTLGAIGCAMSHLKIYDEMINNNVPYAIIFEDDIQVSLPKEEFWRKAKEIDIPKDADMFLLSATYYDWIKEISPGSNTINLGRFTGTWAYMITIGGARILHKKLLPLKYQVDFQMSILMKAGLIKIYGYTGDLIEHGDKKFGTTIQDIKCDGDCVMTDLDGEAELKRIEGFSKKEMNENLKIFLVMLLLMLALVINYL